jgi:hypothetical protein
MHKVQASERAICRTAEMAMTSMNPAPSRRIPSRISLNPAFFDEVAEQRQTQKKRNHSKRSDPFLPALFAGS